MIAIAEKTVHVRDVQHVRAHRLRIEFTDGKTTEVDFEPFLQSATHPSIRRYLQPRRFKQFAITNLVCCSGTISTSSSRWPTSMTA